MKRKAVEITIAEPCTQDWNSMEKRDGYNFCNSCSKSVIDFSGYSNADIIKLLSNSSSTICGRMSQAQLNQLNYYLIAVPTNKNWLKYLGVLAIGASIFIGDANASVLKTPIHLEKNINEVKTTEKPNVKMIFGYIYDEDKKPISGARVMIANTKLFATTDGNGRYEILLGKNFDTNNNIIKVKSLRFEGSLKADYSKGKQPDLAVNCVYMIMGKIAMTNKN